MASSPRSPKTRRWASSAHPRGGRRFRLILLHVVDGGGGGVGAAGRGGPADDAGLCFLDVPAGGLLAAVVASARGVQIALAGGPFGVWDDMVEVAVHGLGAAAAGGATRGAGADQVLERAGGGVAVLGIPVVAGPLGDGPGDGVQGAQEVGELRCLGGVGAFAGRPVSGVVRGPVAWRVRAIRRTWVMLIWVIRGIRANWVIWVIGGCPGVAAVGAGVGHRGAVGSGEGDAPAGCGVL